MVALQAVGAAAGNMIAIHNVVAASATVGLLGREGTTLRKTILPTLYYVTFTGILGLIGFYVLGLGDPLLTEARVRLLGIVDGARLSAIEQLARRINGVLQPFFDGLELQLVDFKLELGLNAAGELLLADEISPDTCRFWDATTQEKMDKDRFRRDLGGVVDAYEEVWRRLTKGAK